MSLLKALVLIGGAVSQVPAGDTVTDWNSIANVPSTFPPAIHSHSVADVSGLQATLDAKANLAGAAFTGGISGTTAAFSSTATFNGAAVFNGAFSVTAASIVLDRIGDAAAAQFYMRSDAGFAREFTFQTGTSTRWGLRVNNVAEAGANAGSNLQWISYDDAGAVLASPLQITRSTGIAAFSASPTAPTPSPGDNTTKLATTAFVTAGIGAAFAANDALLFKGVIDASTNPNYPAADAGHVYRISVAGKIGGAAGPNVEVGDTLYAITDGSAAGDHATVGANWSIVQSNLDGAVIGPSAVVDGNPTVFNGPTGKLIKEVTFAAFKTSLAIMVADVGGLQTALDGKAALVHGHVIADVSGLQGALDAKAPLASPTFTGVPAGPTAAPGTNTTQLASTAFVTAAVAAGGGGGGPIAFSDITGTLLDAQLSGNYTNVGALTASVSLTVNHPTAGGVLNVKAATTAGLFLDSPAGQVKGVYFRTGTATPINRWTIFATTTAETGAEAGSNLQISRYDDAGVHLGATVVITRATGEVSLYGNLRMEAATAIIHSGSATEMLDLSGGNGAGATLGGRLRLFGHSHAGSPGDVILEASNAGDVSIVAGSKAAAATIMRVNTADGQDSGQTSLYGGGGGAATRGAIISAFGNEHGSYPGRIRLVCGDAGNTYVENGSLIISAGNLTITGKLSAIYFGSKTWDPPSIQNTNFQTTTVTVSSAQVGDAAIASFTGNVGADLICFAKVTANNVVTVWAWNNSGAALDPVSGTLRVWVFGA